MKGLGFAVFTAFALFSSIAFAQESAQALKGIENARSQEEYDRAVLNFLDKSTPEENEAVFGSQTAQEVETGTDIKAMLWDASNISAMGACFEDPANEIDITVHISPSPYPRGQWLEATYPGGGTFGPIPISSAGIAGKITPKGCYKNPTPVAMAYSHEYGNSPMPHALFFIGRKYAIHGTLEEDHLGHPASHGCVRVSQANAANLYQIVQEYGAARTHILIEE